MKIVDVIDHKNKYCVQRMVVLDQFPEFIYERVGTRWLVGWDGIAMSFYGYEEPDERWKAFGGERFEIKMDDGTIEHAYGQWWSVGAHPEFRELLCQLGVSTVERLQQCHVFTGGIYLDRIYVDEWLESNEPSNNYHKYDLGHKDFGKQKIVSQWE